MSDSGLEDGLAGWLGGRTVIPCHPPDWAPLVARALTRCPYPSGLQGAELPGRQIRSHMGGLQPVRSPGADLVPNPPRATVPGATVLAAGAGQA